MIKNQLFIGAALLVGVAIGYFLKPDAPREAAMPEKGYVAASKIDDRGDDATREALKRRVAELERLLATATAQQAPTAQPVVAEAQAQGQRQPDWRHGPPSAKDMRERMEKLKKEDPKRYEEISKRMAQFRQRRLDRAGRKLDFLAAIDTSTMTDDQKKAHEQYQELIAKREELEEKMHGENVSDEDRDAAMKAMHETDRQMRQAARQERETLIEQTAQALGFTGDDAQAVSETLRNVISSTETGHGMPPPPPNGAGPSPR